MKNRPGLKFKVAGLRPKYIGAGNIAGQQVGRKLNALKTAVNFVGQTANRPRLCQPRGAFNQQVAVGEQGHDQSVYQRGLANNPVGKLLSQVLNNRLCIGCCHKAGLSPNMSISLSG